MQRKKETSEVEAGESAVRGEDGMSDQQHRRREVVVTHRNRPNTQVEQNAWQRKEEKKRDSWSRAKLEPGK
jgi:hypothetical protein